jgi:hypothetical protein
MGNLSVREVLDKTYEILEKKFKHKTITFPEEATPEIANDSDWHRTRTGCMSYKKANVFRFNGKEWAVAIGRACGSYPADPYDTDLSAIQTKTEGKLEEQIQKEIMEGFERSGYFRNSIVYGMSDGSLAVGQQSPFKEKVMEILRPQIENYLAKPPQYHDRFITMDLRPLVTGRAEYKPKFADFLAESIQKILENAK